MVKSANHCILWYQNSSFRSLYSGLCFICKIYPCNFNLLDFMNTGKIYIQDRLYFHCIIVQNFKWHRSTNLCFEVSDIGDLW